MAYESNPSKNPPIQFKGTLRGHSDWVTQIATLMKYPDTIISASRDKSLILWKLNLDDSSMGMDGDDFGGGQQRSESIGKPHKSMYGHGHFISDVVLSSDGDFAISGSWDKTMRLWDLKTNTSVRRFVSHTKDVLSVAFSIDNRQIVSGSRDKSIKLWNTLAECKYTITDDCHSEWVSCVRFSPNNKNPIIVSCGWDRLVKVWNMSNCRLNTSHYGHSGYLNTVTVSPDGSLCASGGKDGKAMLWDLNEHKHLHMLNTSAEINALCFSPTRYWLCAAVGSGIKIWDLEDKSVVDELRVETTGSSKIGQCTSLAWSADGSTLFAGYTDHNVRVWHIGQQHGY